MRALTDREREVLALVAEGFTNPQIGRRLHISEATVKWTLKRVFRVLQARDRAHAVALAFRTGVFSLDRPRRVLRPHGTHAAAQRHRYHREDLCDACVKGEREFDKVRKRVERSAA